MKRIKSIAKPRWQSRPFRQCSLLMLTVVLFIFLSLPAMVAAELPTVGQALGLDSLPTAAVQPATERLSNPGQAQTIKYVQNPQQLNQYSENLRSEVFGAHLFTGTFAGQSASLFSPDYSIMTGDVIQVRLWGAFDFEANLTVDPKGNIFIPHAGPVQVLGVRNRDVQGAVDSAVAKVFKANVYSYATLASAQPVRVYVSGFVRRPGLYNGTSTDGLLHYLDLAGGIDPERGSFLNVKIKRGDVIRATVNLYDFLLNGQMPLVQFADGDLVFVESRQNTVIVSGLAQNPKRFEFSHTGMTVSELVGLAKPKAETTHVRIIRNSGSIRNIEYYSLAEADSVSLENGDALDFTADKKPGTITVRVEGEHDSAQEYVLPYGAEIGELLDRIQVSERSDLANLQLFRRSVQERQTMMLQTSLKSLETAALTARSGTSDEARLRKDEAELILQWVERAKQVEPTGQVYIAKASQRDELLLENGDRLYIPAKDGLVLVSGEVLFPTAVAHDSTLSLEDYIGSAGGFAQNADSSRIIVAHKDGRFSEAESRSTILFGEDEFKLTVSAGDQILVLPKIDVKSRQIAKDLTQILYQIAVSAKVVLGL